MGLSYCGYLGQMVFEVHESNLFRPQVLLVCQKGFSEKLADMQWG